MVQIGSVLCLYWTKVDSLEARYVSDRSDMDSDWIRYAFGMGAIGVWAPLTLGMVFNHKSEFE